MVGNSPQESIEFLLHRNKGKYHECSIDKCKRRRLMHVAKAICSMNITYTTYTAVPEQSQSQRSAMNRSPRQMLPSAEQSKWLHYLTARSQLMHVEMASNPMISIQGPKCIPSSFSHQCTSKYKGHANGADPSPDHDAATDPPLGAA